MFADVSGSTQMYEKWGDSLAHECVSASLKRIIHHIESHSGRVVETIGDEVMTTFESIDDAVQASIAMQKHFFVEPAYKHHFVKIRVGFHFGPIEYDEGHPFGDTVNVAARVASLCESGCVIATRATLDKAKSKDSFFLRPYQRTSVKGKSKPLMVEEIVWDSEDATSLFSVTNITQAIQLNMANTSLVIQYLDKSQVLNSDSGSFLVGRGGNCDLVVDSSLASRTHAKIEFRWGDIVLTDHSTNGTFLQYKPGKEEPNSLFVHLHRREISLLGKGVVGIGTKIESADPVCLLYFDIMRH